MKRRLMIIEEDPFERDIFERIFSSKYDIIFVPDVRKLSARFKRNSPDVVLLDMSIPDIGLLDEVSFLKNSGDRDVPLIVIASENPIELERAAREDGIFYYIVRPFDMKELDDVLRSAFSRAVQKSSINSK